MGQTLRTGKPVRGVEAVLERPDGSRVLFAPHPTPLFDANGKLTGAVNLLLDITQQRNFERSQAHLSAIVESSDDAILSNFHIVDGARWRAIASDALPWQCSNVASIRRRTWRA